MITTAHITGAVTAAILAVSLTACGTKAEHEPQAPSVDAQPRTDIYGESGFGPRKDIYGESGFGPRKDIYGESGFGPRKDIYGESGFGPRR